jgi:hypothetical protein
MKHNSFPEFLKDIGAEACDSSNGGYLVPERTREEISKGIRKLLVKLGIFKPRYRWFRMRDYLIESASGKEVNPEDYYINE